MHNRLATLLVTTALMLPALAMAEDKAAPAAAAPLTRSEVEAIVKDYIHNHPEEILQSVNMMQQKQYLEKVKQASEAITKRKADIYEDPSSPVAGNPKGDVTIVEFFDYNCGYCKRMLPVMSKVIGDDKNVKVVFKEFPILSESSVMASKASQAVYRIDKGNYFAFHTALMKLTGGLNEDAIMKVATSLDIDTDDLKEEMKKPDLEKEIGRNMELAEVLGVNGTPAFIIGDELVPGAIDEATLVAKIKAARAKAAKKS